MKENVAYLHVNTVKQLWVQCVVYFVGGFFGGGAYIEPQIPVVG